MSKVSLATERDKAVVARAPRTKWVGLLTRKERWHLSWRAWLLLLAVACAGVWLVMANAYSFLAVNRPIPADVVVVEGWLDDWAFKIAAKEFAAGNYRVAFVTGGPVPGIGGYVNDFQTFASVGAERLIHFGEPRERVQIVPSREAARDRTYASAAVLKLWFRENNFSTGAVNVVTQSTHARRTQILFRKALRPEIEVGVISATNPDFNPRDWWRFSEGVRDVVGEGIAFIYAAFFFSPEE